MRKSKTSSQLNKQKLAILVILIISTGMIFWRISSHLPKQSDGYMRLNSTLLDEPEKYERWQYFDIDVYRVKANSEIDLQYGDQLEVEGEVVESRFENPDIQVVGRSNWRKILFNIRTSLREKIFSFLPEPQASLLAGVTLGSKEDLPENFRESLISTGTIHVVVVSGYNISVIAGFLIGLARFIRRRYAIIIALVAITFYTLLVGADPPAVRAAIMGAVGFTAITLGRQRISLYSLGLAAVLMLAVNPLVVSDIGFQLSFLATAGIIMFQGSILKFLKFLPRPFNEDLSTTLAAQSLVVPVIFYHFGAVSAISPVANALVLWTIPLATVLGFIFLALSFVIPILAMILAWIIWAFLFIFTSVVEIFSRLPITNFEFEPNQILPLLIYYTLLFLGVYYLKNVRVARAKQVKS